MMLSSNCIMRGAMIYNHRRIFMVGGRRQIATRQRLLLSERHYDRAIRICTSHHHHRSLYPLWRLMINNHRAFSAVQDEKVALASTAAATTTTNWEGLEGIRDTMAKTTADPISSRRLYRYLRLESFTDQEIEERFIDIARSGDTHNNEEELEESSSQSLMQPQTINRENFESYLEQFFHEIEIENEDEDFRSQYDDNDTKSIRKFYSSMEAKRCWDYLEINIVTTNRPKSDIITKEEFVSTIIKTASSLEVKKLFPLTTSMLLVGSSVGVTTPAMPFVVQNLGLTAGEYGLVVSAFALSKMAGNIPSAVLVERYGRKPYLVYTMALVAVGVGGIGLATSFEHLYLCRLVTGLGVSCLSAAVTMTVTDLSTPLNRASTFAPIMSAFAAGTALGPALGGFLCDGIGINPTFYLVGASYVGLAAVNNILLNETKPRNIELPWQHPDQSNSKQQVSIKQSFEDALGQWIPLLSTAPIRNVCLINGFYWVALAGSQMTLLPLILTDPAGLAMTATDVGKVYMGMSCVQVLGNPIFAKFVDRIGKVPGIVSGCLLISTAMGTLPLCGDLYQMAGVLGMWAAGSSLLSTSPISFISDKVADEKRAQAIALLRTSGDVGFLIGASSMGALADFTGSLDVAMQSSSGVLLTATGWFMARSIMTSKVKEKKETTML